MHGLYNIKKKLLVVCLSLQMQQLCTVTVFLQMAALVLGTNNVTKMTEQPRQPSKCFHQPSSVCSGSTGCVNVNGSEDTAVCCHLTQFGFLENMGGTVSLMYSFRASCPHHKQISETNRQKTIIPPICITFEWSRVRTSTRRSRWMKVLTFFSASLWKGFESQATWSCFINWTVPQLVKHLWNFKVNNTVEYGPSLISIPSQMNPLRTQLPSLTAVSFTAYHANWSVTTF